jgi:hypothetical protein
MGEKQNEPFQLSFNASLKVDFQGSGVTSDGGLILMRELDERLGLGDFIAEHLSDQRRGKSTQLPLAEEENFAGLARINRELIGKAEALEARGVKYAIRIPSNDSLERDIAELLTRPVGRPSYKPVVWYKSFLYQATTG